MAKKKTGKPVRKVIGKCVFCGDPAYRRTRMNASLKRELRELGKDPDALGAAEVKKREGSKGGSIDPRHLPVCPKHHVRIIRSDHKTHHLRWKPAIPPEDLPKLRRDYQAGKIMLKEIAELYGVSVNTAHVRLRADYEVED